LEDGAEEFFLKPVKLADMKKLKSHLVRRKQPPLQPQEKPQPVAEQQQEPVPQQQKPEQAPREPAEEAAAEVAAISDCSKKRKAVAVTGVEQEALSSPGRTKPRLSSSGLAVET
jgi:two-component response regulator (ARR-A family)